ncbi:MAG: hypothetical protein JW748_02465 [Anaerolineales bacterium]|nr:hypothetical protein [Anaerolineales bacterium]
MNTSDNLFNAISNLAIAANDHNPVNGWTHNFYRYPARFSPEFAAAAIDALSKPGDLVLDPYMGGGTTVIEGIVRGRQVVGNDLNSLAAFVARVKVTGLKSKEITAIKDWASHDVDSFKYDRSLSDITYAVDPEKTMNLSLLRGRFIKKVIAIALGSINQLPTRATQDFARCALLKAGQWSLDGRIRQTSLPEFRDHLRSIVMEMLDGIQSLATQVIRTGGRAMLLNGDAAELRTAEIFRVNTNRVSLVVTSPPYPGVHMLYHRWQVDGRHETPAPYWIAGCEDGQGASYYNFGDRREDEKYFLNALRTLKGIRDVLLPGAFMVQLLAFGRPKTQLSRYLATMKEAGFEEISFDTSHVGMKRGRIWRDVPNRRWHAAIKGNTHSSKEVVLLHRAI